MKNENVPVIEIHDKKMTIVDPLTEIGFVKDYVANHVDKHLGFDALRSLWTSFCLHQNVRVETAEYDSFLMDVWGSCRRHGLEFTDSWSGFDDFCGFMCKYLV